MTTQPTPVLELLRNFTKLPLCGRYKSDGERIKLMSTFIWIHQLVPDLPFEKFLELYSNVADFDAENRKHPDDALKTHCPRSKSQADKAKSQQWTAKQVAEFMTLYIDVIRECDRTAQPIPVTFDQYLEAMKSQFLDGKIAAMKPEKAERATKKKAAPPKVCPTSDGQRVIYERPQDVPGPDVRGIVTGIVTDGERKYVNIQADDGQTYPGINIMHCSVIDDPPPADHKDPEGGLLQTTMPVSYVISKSQADRAAELLSLPGPTMEAPLGEVLLPLELSVANGKYLAEIRVRNGEPRPYVDASLLNVAEESTLAELPPRENILGDYTFPVPADGVSYTINLSVQDA